MFLEFDGKRYPYVGMDLTPRDIMALQVRLVDAEFTACRSFEDVRQLGAELHRIPREEQKDHPEFLFWSTVVLWSAMRGSGERVSIETLIDMPIEKYGTLRVVKEPGDGEGAGKARPLSGSEGGNRAARRKTKTAR